MSGRTVRANSIDIWCEEHGDPADPTIVLIPGATLPGIAWPDEFCEALVDGGRHVVRFDPRDTGRSTRFELDATYTFADMVDDVVGLLDALDVDRAHVAGFSLGGGVTWCLGALHPDRVRTLTPMGTTVAPFDPEKVMGWKGMPAPSDEVLAAIMDPPASEDPADLVERMVRVGRAFAGHPIDESAARERLKRIVEVGLGMGHALVGARSPDSPGLPASIAAPTLVIHGTIDPVLPLVHAETLAEAIPGAELLTIDGWGHDFLFLADGIVPRLAQAILDHTEAYESSRVG